MGAPSVGLPYILLYGGGGVGGNGGSFSRATLSTPLGGYSWDNGYIKGTLIGQPYQPLYLQLDNMFNRASSTYKDITYYRAIIEHNFNTAAIVVHYFLTELIYYIIHKPRMLRTAPGVKSHLD